MGTVLLAVCAGVSIYGIKTYKETRGRRIVSLGIFAAGTFFAVPLLQALFIREMDLAGWIFCICSAVGIPCVYFDGAVVSTGSFPSNARLQKLL